MPRGAEAYIFPRCTLRQCLGQSRSHCVVPTYPGRTTVLSGSTRCDGDVNEDPLPILQLSQIHASPALNGATKFPVVQPSCLVATGFVYYIHANIVVEYC